MVTCRARCLVLSGITLSFLVDILTVKAGGMQQWIGWKVDAEKRSVDQQTRWHSPVAVRMVICCAATILRSLNVVLVTCGWTRLSTTLVWRKRVTVTSAPLSAIIIKILIGPDRRGLWIVDRHVSLSEFCRISQTLLFYSASFVLLHSDVCVLAATNRHKFNLLHCSWVCLTLKTMSQGCVIRQYIKSEQLPHFTPSFVLFCRSLRQHFFVIWATFCAPLQGTEAGRQHKQQTWRRVNVTRSGVIRSRTGDSRSQLKDGAASAEWTRFVYEKSDT